MKVPTMVSDKLFGNVEPGDNLVENEMSGYLTVGLIVAIASAQFMK